MSYINYAKYGTDSNTEDEYKPKQKKPRVGQQPSATREISQTVITQAQTECYFSITPKNTTNWYCHVAGTFS